MGLGLAKTPAGPPAPLPAEAQEEQPSRGLSSYSRLWALIWGPGGLGLALRGPHLGVSLAAAGRQPLSAADVPDPPSQAPWLLQASVSLESCGQGPTPPSPTALCGLWSGAPLPTGNAGSEVRFWEIMIQPPRAVDGDQDSRAARKQGSGQAAGPSRPPTRATLALSGHETPRPLTCSVPQFTQHLPTDHVHGASCSSW